MSKLASYEQRIRALFPEIVIQSASLNDDGLLNDVVIVNDELVFRFAKRDFFYKDPREEAHVLRFLRQHITLRIPEPFYESEEILAYHFIPGETLRRDMLLRLPEDDQQAIAEQLAQFFKELHGVPMSEIKAHNIPLADVLMKYEGWVKVYGRIREKVFPLMQRHQREWATQHFESHLSDESNFTYEMKMVDTDIPPYHIMYDRLKRRVNGIIDFGCAGLGDPAIDFGVVINTYGESFMNRFYGIYPEAETYLKRARFYAGAIEMRWVLQGIERGEPSWFAVHIGSARDLKY
ncbi:MAG TPA: aminoglycoside phosphotransferase family protein [Pyrinomonadaceae bacterium]|jgi:aminoglycoside 2''-phosphotransferase